MNDPEPTEIYTLSLNDASSDRKKAEAFGIFVTGLRDQMEKSGKIKINQDEMKGLTKGQGSLEGG